MVFRHALFLLALIALSTGAQSQQPGSNSLSGFAPAAEERGTDKNPVAVKVLPSPDTEAQAAKQEEYRKEKAKEDRWLTNSTVWLAFVTTALAIFTGFLWRTTYKLVDEGKNTAKRQLRAYVFYRPDLPISIPVLTEWHTTGMKFRVHNNGQTPAYDLRQLTLIGLRERNIGVVLHPIGFEEDGSRFVLNPGMHSEQLMRTTAPLPQVDMDRFRAGTHAIYIWGEARYRDTFGDHQWCRYAFQITGEGTTSGNLHWCRHGNEAS
jgi:hypothetical protein